MASQGGKGGSASKAPEPGKQGFIVPFNASLPSTQLREDEPMDDLVQWLRAQLDEDERIARRACEYAEASWRLDEDGETVLWWPPEPRVAAKERERGLPVVSDRWRGQTIASGIERIAPHIAEWDPARVLREIDAKRQIIDQHERYAAERRRMMGCWDPQSDDSPILAALAAVYADRPGYREEWAP